MQLPLKAVGVGAGYFAGFQYEAWTRIPEVRMLAVCDQVESKAREQMEKWGIPRYYESWRRMIDEEKPEFIDIITPPDTHEEICAHAADRGIHIACQKPLAPTYEASRRIVDAVEGAGVRFMVHENWRWQPWYRKIREIRDSSLLGEFTHLYFRMRTGDGWGERAYLDRQPFFRGYPRLLIFETGVHFVDTFRFLLGEVREVYASLRRLNPVIRGEDTGQVFFRFESGATAIWDANRYNEVESTAPRFTFGELRIDGMKGHLTMDTSSNMRVKLLGEATHEVSYGRADVNFAGDSVYATQRHFVDCLIGNAEFETNGRDYLRTLEVVEAIYRSAETGIPVSLPSAHNKGPTGE
jgi:predicted dehydrogenase